MWKKWMYTYYMELFINELLRLYTIGVLTIEFSTPIGSQMFTLNSWRFWSIHNRPNIFRILKIVLYVVNILIHMHHIVAKVDLLAMYSIVHFNKCYFNINLVFSMYYSYDAGYSKASGLKTSGNYGYSLWGPDEIYI